MSSASVPEIKRTNFDQSINGSILETDVFKGNVNDDPTIKPLLFSTLLTVTNDQQSIFLLND